MLPERARNFDWSRLSDVYGSAADVPEQLEKLLEHDLARSESAFGALKSSLFHQSDVTDATAVATLVLGDELARAAARQPAACLELLALFAHAARAWGVCPADQAEAALRHIEQGGVVEGPNGSMNQPQAWQACWGALRRVLPHVIAQLGAGDPTQIGAAAMFIAEIGSEAAPAHDALRHALADPAAHAAARGPLLAALLSTADAAQARALIPELESALGAADDDVRAVSAYGLAKLLGPRTGETALVALADAALERTLPGYLSELAFIDLARLLGERGEEFLLWQLQRCGDYVTLIELLGDTLRFVARLSVPSVLGSSVDSHGVTSVQHGEAFLHTREQLSPAEIRVWRAALANSLLWAGRTDLFAKLGVPSERAALEALLGEQAAAIS
jgi:hypothetical protein